MTDNKKINRIITFGCSNIFSQSLFNHVVDDTKEVV